VLAALTSAGWACSSTRQQDNKPRPEEHQLQVDQDVTAACEANGLDTHAESWPEAKEGLRLVEEAKQLGVERMILLAR
jgi:hypothetical protein